MPNISSYKSASISVGLVLLAAVAALALFRMRLPPWLQYAFVTAVLATAALQTQRLWSKNIRLTEKLIESSTKLRSLSVDEARSRLESGLKLLDTVLSLKEAILFQCESDGNLVSAARLRASTSTSLETSRNSAWREGINLCERAIKAGEIITQEIENGEFSNSIALPLRHENRAVGALLIRLNNEFNEGDRAL
ncbi:MAG: hypothetical protein H0T77_14775, partial [Pyrinomonadaceae bacterium]|nr:hypothetical protein [Pyrinomonadaceae bacterium]